jgi:hypothetical protein
LASGGQDTSILFARLAGTKILKKLVRSVPRLEKGVQAMKTSVCGGCSALIVLAGLLWGAEKPKEAAEGDAGVIHLFNGKDLTNFYTYLGAPAGSDQPLGKNHDPEKVFSVQDGRIRISGQVFGGLITNKEFGDYHLVAEYAWGEKTWPPREDKARDSGILLHCVGEDGAAGKVWMESIECQMIEGGTGDFILVGGKNRPSITVTAAKQPVGEGTTSRMEPYYQPGAPPQAFISGRINWLARDPNWKDVKGFRGKKDAEVAVGEWNRLECICDGDKITLRLNGKVVNACTQSSATKGKILFQSEGAEVFFRKIDLTPLKKQG